MKTVLIISSQVAASRVGASASAFCLQRLGVNTIVLPTTLLGRHPGWGAPGGAAVAPETLASMWNAIAEQDIKIDGVMTGYMAAPAHIGLAARIIKALKTGNPNLITLVDPVMGDHGKLYVAQDIAQGIMDTLLPLADFDTPNLWELGYITGMSTDTPGDIINSAAQLKGRTLVTSVPDAGTIGAMLCGTHEAYQVSHPKFKSVPHGGGDSLAGTFLAHLINGKPPVDAFAGSVAAVYEILRMAETDGDAELPLVRGQDMFVRAAPLPVTTLKN